MFAAIIYSAMQMALYDAKLREAEDIRLKALPKEEFEREMRIREVRALEEQARNPVQVKVKTSVF